VEKEFAQVLRRADFDGMTDRQTMHAVLREPRNAYLARRICWEFTIYRGGASPTYVLMPEERDDVRLLADTLQRAPSAAEVDVVAGVIAGIAPPNMCNAQQLPIIRFHQLYSFALRNMIEAVPRKPQKLAAEKFHAAGEELFTNLMAIASNGVGMTRALTHAALHYGGLYELVGEKLSENSALTDVRVWQSPLSPDRADIHLKFTKRDTGFNESYCFSMDIGGSFPFLQEPLHPSFEKSAA
jgi:hypothetical protein